MGSFGTLVSGSQAKESGAARQLGFLGFDRQIHDTTGPAVGRMAPMELGRREALLFRGDGHGVPYVPRDTTRRGSSLKFGGDK